MDKKSAAARLTALEQNIAAATQEAANLRAIIEAPERAPSLLTKPVPGSEQRCFMLVGNSGKIWVNSSLAQNPDERAYAGGNFFQTEAIANAYKESIDTMLLLRHQPGTKSAESGIELFVIEPCNDMSSVRCENWTSLSCQAVNISPCFDSKESARAAIEAIGAGRILRMFKTLHHVEG